MEVFASSSYPNSEHSCCCVPGGWFTAQTSRAPSIRYDEEMALKRELLDSNHSLYFQARPEVRVACHVVHMVSPYPHIPMYASMPQCSPGTVCQAHP